jgi:hypothetical protein
MPLSQIFFRGWRRAGLRIVWALATSASLATASEPGPEPLSMDSPLGEWNGIAPDDPFLLLLQISPSHQESRAVIVTGNQEKEQAWVFLNLVSSVEHGTWRVSGQSERADATFALEATGISRDVAQSAAGTAAVSTPRGTRVYKTYLFWRAERAFVPVLMESLAERRR